MTSTIESTIPQQMRSSHLDFERVSPTRKSGATNASSLGGTSWAGVPTIWHNTLQPHQSGRPDPGLPASPTRSDSLTPTKTTHTSPFPELRDSSPFAPSKPFRPTLSSLPNGPSAVTRTSAQLQSAQVKRSLGPSDVNVDNTMPHLGTAALLNGSAPDVDLASAQSYHPATPNENRLRALNIGSVHEFIPAQQPTLISTKRFGSRYGDDTRSASTSRPTTGFNANSQSFVPTYRNFGGPFGQSQSRTEQSNAIMQLSQPTTRSDEAASPTHRFNFTQPSPTSLGHDLNQFSSSLSVLYVSDNPNLRLPFSYDERSQVRMVPTAVNAGETRNGTARNFQPLTDQTGSSAVPQSNGNLAANHYVSNKVAAPSFESGVYTPSCTPPTASGSRRSNSGSGTSTRASSQSVETRVGGFDTQTLQNRYMMYQNQMSTPGVDYLPLATLSNGCVAPQALELQQHSGQSQYVPQYNQLHQHHASQGRMEHDREQNLSTLMKEFRANHKTKRYELKDAYNHIVEFSGDQHGSRFIQLKLETANSDEKEKVFNEIQENALQLMTDIFGNYVIQKLFEHGTQTQKKILSSQMKGRIHYLTTQVYGCRVVQKALEHVLTDQQASMVKELEGNVLSIIENQNGNHVIQKAIEWVPGEHIQFVYDAARGQIVRLSKHNYGCRVVQRMLEHGNPSAKRSILNELHEAIPNLIEDQFGNYVMQHIIQHGESVECQMVVNIVQQRLLYYSKHKFASNVVEIAIEAAEEHQRQDILRNLTTGTDAQGQSQVYGLIRDQYGNYVIREFVRSAAGKEVTDGALEKVLTKLHGAALKDLISEIQHHLVTLRKISHGKQVSAMEKAIAEASAKLGPHQGNHVSLIPSLPKAGLPPMPNQIGEFQSRYAQLCPPPAHRQRPSDRAY